MKHLILILSIFTLLSCNKETSKNMADTTPIPLKAVPAAVVNGKVITLTADKSEGDVCAYGFQMSIGSPVTAHVTFSPNSSAHGTRNPDGTYVSGTCKYIPITATVTETGHYIFSLEVLDKNNNFNWADIEFDVK